MMRFVLRVFFISALFIPSAAQHEQPFASRANLVPVPTLVLDVEHKPVLGLHAGDFIIEDDGVEQTVHMDEAAETEPVSLIIAVQVGRRAHREFERIAALPSMLDLVFINPENEAALVVFDSKLNLARDFTKNADSIEGDLKELHPGDGGAAVLDAVAYSTRLLARRPEGRQRVLLLIGETRDHGSQFAKLDDVVRLIAENNVSIYALPFSPYISQQLDAVRGTNKDEWTRNVDLLAKLLDLRAAMRRNTPWALASITGGEYRLFTSRSGFESDMFGFVDHLHSRYQLSFEPKNPHQGLHQIRVRLRDSAKGRALLFRTTFWVTAPE